MKDAKLHSHLCLSEYTCFANKLSRLTQLPGPIRTMKSHNDLLGESRAINAPREIMRLVNWLMSCAHPTVSISFPSMRSTAHSTCQEDLFMAEADPEIVDDIREVCCSLFSEALAV